ncbi:hypothetical protein BpHYR1_011900 [Brachionus plicatilis]|uniref:Uncharacterized protein n=1 Tax=Brachionus plicatilis TaxID=10195 RepID=A0A3M7PL54_BRAPC|nr:hypothetical protein BpHYR1_011900 [Brachionus plicatilis]
MKNHQFSHLKLQFLPFDLILFEYFNWIYYYPCQWNDRVFWCRNMFLNHQPVQQQHSRKKTPYLL